MIHPAGGIKRPERPEPGSRPKKEIKKAKDKIPHA